MDNLIIFPINTFYCLLRFIFMKKSSYFLLYNQLFPSILSSPVTISSFLIFHLFLPTIMCYCLTTCNNNLIFFTSPQVFSNHLVPSSNNLLGLTKILFSLFSAVLSLKILNLISRQTNNKSHTF